jgi:hypothetical protein
MKSENRLYFVGPVTDFLCIGALSLLSLLGFWLVLGNETSHPVAVAAVIASYFVNWPHFSATSFRLFRRKENRARFPLTTFVIPCVVALGVFAAFSSPTIVAPYFVKLFLLWSPYHFSGQTLGISLLYAKRAGIAFTALERKALAYFIFGTFLVPSLRAEVGISRQQYYEIYYPSLNIPSWAPDAAMGVLVLSFLVLVGSLSKRAIRKEKFLPLICFLPALAQYGWFMLGSRVPSFYFFVPFFHSLQYLLIAWAMQLAERKAEVGRVKPFFRTRESAQWFAINLIGGASLFYLLPELAHRTGIALPLATGILIAGVQIHHFIVDGVIWKLRNPQVASPLMASWADFEPKRREAA